MFGTSKNANHQYKAKYLKRLRRSLAFIKINRYDQLIMLIISKST